MAFIRKILVFALLAPLGACGPTASPDRPAPSTQRVTAVADAVPIYRLRAPDARSRRWVDSVLSTLDRRERVAQLVMPWMWGRYVSAAGDEYRTIERWVKEVGVGGLITSIGPPIAMADKLNRLQRAAEVPLLIGADLEYGPGQRIVGGLWVPGALDLGGGTDFPPVMALGATGDPELAYELGRVTAREGRAVGIHISFAPVVDVNNNPANPVINTRSYGEDPGRVAAFGAAQVRGFQEHGMLAVAKHFPGHGDVSSDTHLVPYILRKDADRLEAVELTPFRAAIDAGVAGVMSAHISVPALSGDSIRPATLSPRMLDSLLVREMGFEGLVVTDALNMGALVSQFGAGEAAVLALEAGADILLQPTDPAVIIEAVMAAVETGRVSDARVERSVRKILDAKARVGLHHRRTVPIEGVAAVVGHPEHQDLARRIAERSLTLPRDPERLVPISPLAAPRVLSLVYVEQPDPFPARWFHSTLAEGVPRLERAILRPGTPTAVLDSLRVRAGSADLLVFVSDVRVRSGAGHLAVDPGVARLVDSLAAEMDVIGVSLGNPYLLDQFPGVDAYLLAWGGGRESQTAAARALLGEIPITGRLPVSIPPYHTLGEGLVRETALGAGIEARREEEPGSLGLDAALLDSVDAAVRSAIRSRITPGAALAVGTRQGLVRLRGYGAVDYAPGSSPADDSTVYDLASLTKVVGTTTAIMLLVDDGRLHLDTRLSEVLPAWPTGGWRDSVTIRRLLSHSAGLPPFVRFWHPSAGAIRGDSAVIAAIAALDPEYPPGNRTVYSDLGFILLGAAAEATSGQRLEHLLRERVWAPLGMHRTGFNPRPEQIVRVRREGGMPEVAREPLAPLDRIAPTEVDTVFRAEHVRGVVHDENAYAMGGVAGHAGLFSTAADLSRFAAMLLGGGSLDGVRVLRAATVDRFTRRQGGSARALGWDAADPGGPGISGPFSERAFGHTGFTGTSLWVDPRRGLFVVLLTNRVNPTREGGGITDLRRRVHEFVTGAAEGATGDI